MVSLARSMVTYVDAADAAKSGAARKSRGTFLERRESCFMLEEWWRKWMKIRTTPAGVQILPAMAALAKSATMTAEICMVKEEV